MQIIKIYNPFQRQCREIEEILHNDLCIHTILQNQILDFGGRYNFDITTIDMSKIFTVSINGNVIPSNVWLTLIPKDEDQLVIMPIIGKGGKEKQILNIVTMIAVIYFFGPTSTMTGWQYAVSAAIVVGTGMLLSALTPKPQLKTPSVGDQEQTQIYGWHSATVQEQGIVIPKIYGKLRVYGNVISAFTELSFDNKKQNINALFALSDGPTRNVEGTSYGDDGYGISNIQINNQPINNFTDITHEERFGTLNQLVIENFNDTKIERSVNVGVTFDDFHVYTTSNPGFSHLEITIQFPRGIFYADDSGGLVNYNIGVKIEISETAAETWTTLFNGTITDDKSVPAFRQYDTKTEFPNGLDTSKDYDIKVSKTSADISSERYGDDLTFHNIREVVVADFVYPKTSLLSLKALATDKLSGSIRFSCELEGKIINVYNGSSWSLEYSTNPAWVIWDIFTQPIIEGAGTSGSPYAIAQESGDDIYRGIDPELSAIQPRLNLDDFYEASQYYETQVPDGTGVDVTDITQSSPGVVSASGHTHSNGEIIMLTDVEGMTEVNGNLYTVANVVAGVSYELSGVNTTGFTTYTGSGLTSNVENLINFNGGFDVGSSVWESVLKVCEIGRCIPYFNGSQIGIKVNKPADPAQMFTVGNTNKESFEEVFLPQAERISELQINFVDSEQDYDRVPFNIFNVNIPNATHKMSLDLFGITKSSEAWRAGMFRLKQNELLKRTLTFNANIDAIICSIGDNIWVQHDVPNWGSPNGEIGEGSDDYGGGGRLISAILVDSGSNTQLTLDRKMLFTDPDWDAGGNTYELMVRTKDDNIEIKTIIGGYIGLTAGSVAHWKMNDNDPTTTVVDSSGKHHHGTAERNTEDMSVVGKINEALDFNGTDDFVTIPDHADFTFGDGVDDSPFSLADWIFVPAAPSGIETIIGKWGSSFSGREWLCHLDDGKLVFLLEDDTNNKLVRLKTDNALPSGFCHVVVTYDGRGGNDASDGVNLYVNNVIVTELTKFTASGYVAMSPEGADVLIGAHLGGTLGFYPDKIDDVRIFNKVISASERSYLYNAGNGTEETLFSPTHHQITVDGTFNTTPEKGDVWAVGIQNLVAKQFTILSLEESQDQLITIKCIEYNEEVYESDTASMDLPAAGDIYAPSVYEDIEVTGLTLHESAAVDESGVILRQINVNYSIPTKVLWKQAYIYYKAAGITEWIFSGTTTTNIFIINNVSLETTYSVKVVSENNFGTKSIFEDSPTEEITTSSNADFLGTHLQKQVTGLQLHGQGNSTVFSGNHAKFAWNRITAVNEDYAANEEPNGAGSNIPVTWFKDYEIKIYDDDGNLKRVEHITNNFYDYTYEKNYEDNDSNPLRTFKFEIRARDFYNRISEKASSITVSNPAPDKITNFSLFGLTKGFKVKIETSADIDLAGYLVYASQSTPVIITESNIVYRGPDNFFTHEVSESESGTWYIKIAAFDRFGEDGLNISDEGSTLVFRSDPNLSIPIIDPEDLYFIDNSPSAGRVAWNSGILTYQGKDYLINAGDTASDIIFWDRDNLDSDLQAQNGNVGMSDPNKWIMAYNDEGSAYPTFQQKVMHAGILQARSITANQIAAGTITTEELKARTILASDIAVNAVTANEMSVDRLDAVSTNTGILNVGGGSVIIDGDNDVIKVFADTVSIISDINDVVDWTEDAAIKSVVLDADDYSPANLAAEVQAEMRSVGDANTTVTYDSGTKLITIANGTLTTLTLLSLTGVNNSQNCFQALGFTVTSDKTGALTYDATEQCALRVRIGALL